MPEQLKTENKNGGNAHKFKIHALVRDTICTLYNVLGGECDENKVVKDAC